MYVDTQVFEESPYGFIILIVGESERDSRLFFKRPPGDGFHFRIR